MGDCEHPKDKRKVVRYGETKCERCGALLAPHSRAFEIQHTRNFLRAGDPVRVRGNSHEGGFRGRFYYVDGPDSARYYCIGQLDGDKVSQIRHIVPERVTRKTPEREVA